jgi:hypothetical protein
MSMFGFDCDEVSLLQLQMQAVLVAAQCRFSVHLGD